MSAHDSGSAGECFMFVDDTLARLVGMHGVTVWAKWRMEANFSCCSWPLHPERSDAWVEFGESLLRTGRFDVRVMAPPGG